MDIPHDKSQGNLAILSYMGLACQAAGVLGMFASLGGWLTGLWDPPASTLGGALLFVFGMALSGWASNLSLIGDLKKRLSALEARWSKDSGSK